MCQQLGCMSNGAITLRRHAQPLPRTVPDSEFSIDFPSRLAACGRSVKDTLYRKGLALSSRF